MASWCLLLISYWSCWLLYCSDFGDGEIEIISDGPPKLHLDWGLEGPQVLVSFLLGKTWFTEISDETVKPFDRAAQAIDALRWYADVGPVHHMVGIVVAREFNGVLALMESDE
jgi:hypothetical protein